MDFFISFPRNFRARRPPYFLFAREKVPGDVICCWVRLRFIISRLCAEEPLGKP